MMKVHEIMSRPVCTISTDRPVGEAAQVMRQRGVGALPVVAAGSVVGMLTDRDIVVRAVATARDPHQVPAGRIMSVGVHACFADDTVEEASAIMGEAQVRRLPVFDRQDNLVGIVSVGDIAENASERAAGEALGEIVEAR